VTGIENLLVSVTCEIESMNKRISQFDGLRFFAIMVIVLGHVGEGYGRPYESVFGLAYHHIALGNAAFFMLSGFLIAFTYKNKILEGLTFKNFFIKRFLQLYPVYFLGQFVMVLILMLFGNFYMLNFKVLMMSFLMIPCGWITGGTEAVFNGVTWFVSVLLVCYILYWAIVAISRKKRDFYPIAIGFMIHWGLSLCEKSFELPFNYRVNGEGYSAFFMGVLLYEVYKAFKDSKIEKALMACALLFLVVIGLLSYKFQLNNIAGDEYWVLIAMDFAIIYIALTSKIIEKILSFKVFTFLGGISAEICFLHLPVSSMFSYFKYIKGKILFDIRTEFLVYLFAVFVTAVVAHYVYTKRVKLWDWAKPLVEK
jgi:peptidoglycan/LPS O-acetylase OafA/YrhL